MCRLMILFLVTTGVIYIPLISEFRNLQQRYSIYLISKNKISSPKSTIDFSEDVLTKITYVTDSSTKQTQNY